MRTEIEIILNELVHACEDSHDNYPAIQEACAKAKALIPDYKDDEKIFDEITGERISK